ncbi:hypothetical protein C4X49_05830 [Acinetobacter baumannii]|uniref:hypothetical protein n=1 Tax=Acinetobacter baumannii TaxID=470 RepID=UPI001021CF2C|nr:hypothetical protein [Acinetobacter baumannii]QBC46983.1 hypothetical protein C4X49_05830 [Acinetobacter baumannii]
MSSIAPNNDHGNDLQNGSNSSQQASNEAEYRRSASTPQNNAAASNTGQVTPLFSMNGKNQYWIHIQT